LKYQTSVDRAQSKEDAAVVMLLYYDHDDFKAAKIDPSGERLKKGPIKSWLKLGKNRYGPARNIHSAPAFQVHH